MLARLPYLCAHIASAVEQILVVLSSTVVVR